jgi:ubiquinone/menaquinone biosynthesis C-methylase UbiE
MVVQGRPGGRGLAVIDGVAGAYSATGGAWQHGPGRVYDRLAEVLLARSPVPVRGCRVLDVGAGTGAASRAALAAGATAVIALDPAVGMLAHDASWRAPAVAGDALALPFAAATFDVAVAAFSLNHLTDPVGGLREMARVTRCGGALLASSYAADDIHPAKVAVEAALASHGWKPEGWYATMKAEAVPLLATVDACAAAADAAGLEAVVEPLRVALPELDARDLIAWRLGLAQHAPFLGRLTPGQQDAVVVEALNRLGDAVPPLVRSILVVGAVSP